MCLLLLPLTPKKGSSNKDQLYKDDQVRSPTARLYTLRVAAMPAPLSIRLGCGQHFYWHVIDSGQAHVSRTNCLYSDLYDESACSSRNACIFPSLRPT